MKLGVFVRVDNVAVIKLEDNCKFWNYKDNHKISCGYLVVLPLPPAERPNYDACGQACSYLNHDSLIWLRLTKNFRCFARNARMPVVSVIGWSPCEAP